MIDIGVVFWIAIFFVAFSAMMRGWTNELVVISGLVLSPLITVKFGSFIITLWGFAGDPEQVRKKEFYLLMAIHLIIVYVSYKGPMLADRVSKKGVRASERVQDRVMAILAGSVSGYMSVGMVWSLLEYRIAGGTIQRLAAGERYPFSSLFIARPSIDPFNIYHSVEGGIARLEYLEKLITYLPLPVFEPYAIFAVVAALIFIIVVIV